MSDTEENKSGASSALLNIASAYSDSDSSQEDKCEDFTPQKSLGSLVENLRAEAKRAQNEVLHRSEVEHVQFAASEDGNNDSSSTKIAHPDSGKGVKLSTSNSTDVKNDENYIITSDSQSLTVNNVSLSSAATALTSPDHCVKSGVVVSSECGENSNISRDPLEKIQEPEVRVIISDNKETNSQDAVKSNETDGEAVSSSILEENSSQPLITKNSAIYSEDQTSMGLRSSKKEMKSDGKSDVEDVVVEQKSHDSKTTDGKKQYETVETDKFLKCSENSGCDHSGLGLLDVTVSNKIHDKDVESASSHGILKTLESATQDAKDTRETKEKSVSSVSTDLTVNDEKIEIKEVVTKSKPVETNVMAKDSETEEGDANKPNVGSSVGGLDINLVSETSVKMNSLKVDENAQNESSSLTNTDSNIDEKMKEIETKTSTSVKVVDQSTAASADTKPPTTVNTEIKSLSERSTTTASNKVFETPALDARKSTAPIKLKRNFSCISTTVTPVTQPEKKFQPEPSQAARSGPSNSATLRQEDTDASASQSNIVNKSHVRNHPQEHQEEAMMSPPRMRPTSPARSPTFQQSQPQQEQTFANAINSTQNQVSSFETPKMRSPSPPRVQTRITRREEKRRLPIILRKSGAANTRSKDPPKSDNLPPPRSDSIEEDVKPKNEPEIICLDTTSLESEGQSACVPFSTSSSNLENSSTFGGSVDFDNTIESNDVINKSSVAVDSGSDNAQPAPALGGSTKEPTSFLAESAAATPTITIPKKRGRPRKFPLPETGVDGTWSTQTKTPKSGKRRKTATKKFRPEGDGTDEEETPKRRYIPRYLKKKSDADSTPETPRIFNKKGRMEVMTEGCKPVTVNQITEYFWPPVSTLGPGEKAEGLMIQEQISEYLGVKSFKRKYPSIKRRPVDMEERNYLQENGFVSENMCDMGLTAVYSADIIEIMYNDFPNKFEEYRRYTREKKLKEQKALREKQAAENMDPRKEALESISSWNTEFNKTRNYRVLLGEWYERRFDEEFKLAMYLKKKERDALLLSKVRRLFSNLLRDVQLSLPTRGLAYGGLIQLLAPDVSGHSPLDSRSSNRGLVLSVTLEIEDIDFRQDFDEHLLIVGSPVLPACARNSFYIDPEDKAKEGQALCYGDMFFLRCAADTTPPLYVSVPVFAPFRPVGKSGFPIPRLTMNKDADSRFRVLNLKPELRTEIEGLPVLPFERVLIFHAPSGIPLCTETDFWDMSLFSPECEISTHAMMTLKKEYGPENQIGNWYNDLMIQEEILQQYLKKNDANELKVQKARKLFLTMLTEVPLTFPVQGLCYGAAIQIMSKESPTSNIYNLEKNHGMVLTGHMDYKVIDERSTLFFDDPVIASGLLTPCARNVWTLVPCDPSQKSKPIRFGDEFYIQLYSSKIALYVDAPVAHPMLPRGECGEVIPRLSGFTTPTTRFKVVHVYSKLRYETEGQMVPPFERVVLLHAATAQALAIECDSWIPSYFEKRPAYLDLQTFTVHFPASEYPPISLGRTGHYPVAIIPGQNTDYYKEYTSTELKYFPLNTVLYGPVRPNSRRLVRAGSEGSQSDSDESSSSDDSSSSSSGETQDTDTSSSEESAPEVKVEKEKPPEKVEEVKPPVVTVERKRGRPLGSGKKNNPNWNPDQPRKRLGRPPKIRPPVAAVTTMPTVSVKKLDDEDPAFFKRELEKAQKYYSNSQKVICKMCQEEESKNKNRVFEAFITCAQCNGKIHPSCIDLTPEMIPNITSYGWQCTDCKSCVRCDQSSNEDKMIFCDLCDRGYHIFCVGLKKVPSGSYICTECKPPLPPPVQVPIVGVQTGMDDPPAPIAVPVAVAPESSAPLAEVPIVKEENLRLVEEDKVKSTEKMEQETAKETTEPRQDVVEVKEEGSGVEKMETEANVADGKMEVDVVPSVGIDKEATPVAAKVEGATEKEAGDAVEEAKQEVEGVKMEE